LVYFTTGQYEAMDIRDERKQAAMIGQVKRSLTSATMVSNPSKTVPKLSIAA
jgi:hypothetical protein